MRIIIFFCALWALAFSSTVTAGSVNYDTVRQIYLCGNDLGIEMESAGWIRVRGAEVSEKKFDRILTLATSMLLSGKRTSYFGLSEERIQWCGFEDVRKASYSFGMRAD